MPRRKKRLAEHNGFIMSLLSKYGREYRRAVLPKDINRGPTGKCFDWCALQAAAHHKQGGKYRYVEGIASDPERPGEWILHAWLTDGIHAFDPTWAAIHDVTGKEVPIPARYIGIEMPILKVARFMNITGYQSAIGNHWRAPGPFEDILASCTITKNKEH